MTKLPPDLILLEEFIDEATETELLNKINEQPWLNQLKRRVQHYGYPYNYKARIIEKDPNIPEIPEWTLPIEQRLLEEGYIDDPFEQLIINEYQPGQGISRHSDANSFGNRIVSLSLGSPCTMIFRNSQEEPISVILPRRSLIIMKNRSRWEWTHEIPNRKGDRTGTRVSLTFRYLLKTDPKPKN